MEHLRRKGVRTTNSLARKTKKETVSKEEIDGEALNCQKDYEKSDHNAPKYVRKSIDTRSFILRSTSVDTPSLLHRYSIASPSKRWTNDGLSMYYLQRKSEFETFFFRFTFVESEHKAKNDVFSWRNKKKFVSLHATGQKKGFSMDISASQERYVNFYTDFAFKKLFGTEVNKELLISFLNSLFNGEEVIKDLKYLNVEHLGHAAAERKAVFDVYCENELGEKFLIEMQKAEQDYFKDRSIYYSTLPIQEQAPRGKWNFELKKVYTIGILNFTFDNDNTSYLHHKVKLMDEETSQVFYDKLTYVYLEMPKFNKEESELETLFDKWLYAIKNLATLMERPVVLQEAVFKRLFEQAEIAAFTKEELHDYRESQKDLWDLNSVLETAENKGIKKVAKKMLEKGYPIDDIMQLTGLNEEEISRLI